MNIGVLALQGAFREHIQALEKLGIATTEVRLPKHLEGVQGLIIPGGESTTMIHLIKVNDLLEPLLEFTRTGYPTWGTCAGMILLSKTIEGGRKDQDSLGGLDVTAHRNYFGSQLGSFCSPLLQGENDVELKACAPAVFIRAPAITAYNKDKVTVLARVCPPSGDGSRDAKFGAEPIVVAVQQKHILATSFHPELGEDLQWHETFVKICEDHKVV